MKYTVTLNKARPSSFLERILVQYIYDIITITFTVTLCYFCEELTEIFDLLR
jgi:hypothetical protein